MNWQTVIGIETHVRLSTRSKLFSGAATAFGAAPNAQACTIDVALPGVLPSLNREAVACAIRFGLAVGGKVAMHSVFARKNYFYPDLPKGYQISQFEEPIVAGGTVTLAADKTVQLTRAHLEEDAGKSVHDAVADHSAIDLNRAGTPLLEIVSEPVLHSAEEALAYARALHTLVRWIGISDGNMQEGSFRCDVNVSLHRHGAPLGTRCEIKNLNSFRFLEQAIRHEVRRQTELLEDGGTVIQETRLYNPDADLTHPMRSKEDSQDYRYFADPDLPPLVLDAAWIASLREAMPELPEQRRRRYETLGLPSQDVAALTAERESGDYFDATAQALGHSPKMCANWVLGEVRALSNRDGLMTPPLSPTALAAILQRLNAGEITAAGAKQLLSALWQGAPFTPALLDQLIQQLGLAVSTDQSALEEWVNQALSESPKALEEFSAGKEKALNAVVGKVMKLSQGRANAASVLELIKQKLTR